MNIVVFGLTISSSWGNGHATLWRSLCRGLHARGHEVTFFERDVSYYAQARDMEDPQGCELRLYASWADAAADARRALDGSDVGIVTSYCPDGAVASQMVLDSRARVKVFYDLDTPITLSQVRDGRPVAYLPQHGLGDFDMVLSYTGGQALDELQSRLGARRVAPLYGSVDPSVHRPARADRRFVCDVSYLGTYSSDRQPALDRLFLQAAARRPASRFVLAGSQYPDGFAWKPNVYYLSHLTPADHPSFYCSSQLTLNVTRGPMAEMGYCPSGRLFEAAACGTAIVTDPWKGIDQFFEPGEEILVASTTEEMLDALDLPPPDRRALGLRALERTLDCHTSAQRAIDLERILNGNINCDRSEHVGHRAGGGTGEPNPTAGVLKRAVAGGQPPRR